MLKFTDRSITGKYIGNDVWLSRQTIKDMLNEDLSEVEASNLEPEYVLAVRKYINCFTDRLERLRI